MMSVTSAITLFLAAAMLQTKNPVKMSIMLLMLGVVLFTLSYAMTSSLWFPLIMYLVFMGGILMMFMILSSILPNEKSEKNEKMVLIAIAAMGVFSPSVSVKMMSGSYSGIKSLVSSSSTMIFFFLIITSYFAVVILMQKFTSSPLRNTMCQKNN